MQAQPPALLPLHPDRTSNRLTTQPQRASVRVFHAFPFHGTPHRIFGFDGWDRKSGWGVTYTAPVRITVTAGNRTLIREGSGAGHGIDADQGLAHESALKEAETEATKRALMTFGNPFGLALYDKQQRQVSSSLAPAEAAVADIPLEPSAIAGLQERIKALD